MGARDHQLGVVDEVTYGTAVTVTRFFEYSDWAVEEAYGRTEGNPLRATGYVPRSDRHTPYVAGASGNLTLDVMDKGFGFWLKHMLGAVQTTGTNPYTHTGTFATLYGDFFTAQVNRPFHPTGTNQAFTYSGGKVTSWTLSNSVDGNLVAELGLDFAKIDTAVALATASYPASMTNFTWAGGVLTAFGSTYDVSEVSFACDNGLNVDRRRIRGNTMKKEPTGDARNVTWSITGDFDALTLRTKAASATRTDQIGTLSCVWTSGSNTLTVTIDSARIDTWAVPGNGDDPEQTLTGIGTYDGTDSPVSIVLVNTETTP